MDIFISELMQANARFKELLDRAIQDLATRDGVSKDTIRLRLGYHGESN